MSWLPSLLFRKSGNKLSIHQTLERPRLSPSQFLKPKCPILLSQNWFLWKDDDPDCTVTTFWDFKWQQRQEDDPQATLFARYGHGRLFSLPEGKVTAGWLLIVPGQLQDEPEGGHLNHRQKWVYCCRSVVDGPLQKVRPISCDQALKNHKIMEVLECSILKLLRPAHLVPITPHTSK